MSYRSELPPKRELPSTPKKALELLRYNLQTLAHYLKQLQVLGNKAQDYNILNSIEQLRKDIKYFEKEFKKKYKEDSRRYLDEFKPLFKYLDEYNEDDEDLDEFDEEGKTH